MVPVWAAEELQAFDQDATRLELDRLAGPGQIIGPPPVDLERREDRRHLLDLTQKGRNHRSDRAILGSGLARGRDLAFAVFGRARFAEAERKAVLLAAIHHERHGLRRLAQRDGQHATGQRIERAAVPCLLRTEQPAHPTDCRRRAQALRLVEDHPTVDLLALPRS